MWVPTTMMEYSGLVVGDDEEVELEEDVEAEDVDAVEEGAEGER